MKNITGKFDKETLCWRDHGIKKKCSQRLFTLSYLRIFLRNYFSLRSNQILEQVAKQKPVVKSSDENSRPFLVFVLNQETVEMLGSPSQHQSHPSRFIIQPANRLGRRVCGKRVCSMLRTLVWHYGDSPDTLKRSAHSSYSSAGKPGWEFTIPL